MRLTIIEGEKGFIVLEEASQACMEGAQYGCSTLEHVKQVLDSYFEEQQD